MKTLNHPLSETEHFIFQCPLCDTVPESERKSFLNDVRYSVKQFGKGELLIKQNCLYNELYILVKGEASTEMVDEKGDFMHIGTIKASNPLAIGFLFSSQNQSPVTAVAITNCTVVTIPKENVYFLMRKYEAFMKAFLSYISDKVAFLSERIRLVSLRTIKAKLAYYLLKESGGETFFTLKTSKEEIARIFGVSRPALVSVMMQMKDDGLIEVDKRNIEIKNRTEMQKLF